jgi:catechol 2,3-dioxygenase-like lactoylglutathione lyase family enzyme
MTATTLFLTRVLGSSLLGSEDGWHRYGVAGGQSGCYVDLHDAPAAQRGAWGVGSIHHLAWRVRDDAHQEQVRSLVDAAGRRPTDVIDRFWFKSVYFLEPGGVLFELATDGPGFAVDEDPAHLGEALVLPPWLEPQRDAIAAALPSLSEPSPWPARRSPSNETTPMTTVGIVGVGSVGGQRGSVHAAFGRGAGGDPARRPCRGRGGGGNGPCGRRAVLPVRVRAQLPFEELLDTDALVIAAGRNGRPDESRLDLLRDNARLMRDFGARLRSYKGIVIMVTNPVDVLTLVLARESGLPLHRVLGTGTMLDSARLRQTIGQSLQVDPRSVHAHVVGEHGDSEVVLWSTAQVAGVPIRRWPDGRRKARPGRPRRCGLPLTRSSSGRGSPTTRSGW